MRPLFLIPLLLLGVAGCGAATAPAAVASTGCGEGAGAATAALAGLPQRSGWVVDEAELIDAPDEARLAGRLAALERQTRDQLVVVTLPSLDGRKIEEVGLALGNGWGVGQAELDNGVVLLVAPNERWVRIEVGCGLEGLLTDARAAEIVDQALLPRFRKGQHQEAIIAGVDRIIATLQSDRKRPQPKRGTDGA